MQGKDSKNIVDLTIGIDKFMSNFNGINIFDNRIYCTNDSIKQIKLR